MPIYREALAALDTLNKGDIVELKSFPNPAEDVVTVVKSVCLLFEVKESWDEGKKLMSNPESFITSLK
jgi:dynein heavy chain